MDDKEVRAGIQQAKLGETGSGILTLECLVLASIAGARSESWGVGIAVFIVSMIVLYSMARSEKLSKFFAALIGFAWGAIAFSFAQSMEASEGAQFGLAVLAFLIGFGGHLNGFQYLRDIERAKG